MKESIVQRVSRRWHLAVRNAAIQLSPSWFLSSKAVFTRPFGGSGTNAPTKSECNRFHLEAN